MSSELTLRDATVDDLDAVCEFLEPFVEAKSLLPRTEDEIRNLLQHAFIAEMTTSGRKDVIGFAALEIYSRKLAEIQCLAVSPSSQGLGIGRRLVIECFQRARRENVLELMAISSNDGFLRRCGFDYSLPQQKRALFVRPQENDIPEE